MYNKVILMGRLTKDVEVGSTQNNKAYARFSLAVNDSYNKEKTHFFNCLAWERKAEVLDNYTRKGCRVQVEGRLENGEYKSKEGEMVKTTTIIVEQVTIIDFKEKDNTKSKIVPVDDAEEDLPF